MRFNGLLDKIALLTRKEGLLYAFLATYHKHFDSGN